MSLEDHPYNEINHGEPEVESSAFPEHVMPHEIGEIDSTVSLPHEIGESDESAKIPHEIGDSDTSARMPYKIGESGVSARMPQEIRESQDTEVIHGETDEKSKKPDLENSVENEDGGLPQDGQDTGSLEGKVGIEEQIEIQNEIISKVESGEIQLESTQEKGNYGEMKVDQRLREMGYQRISVGKMITSLEDLGHSGIDGVYYNPDGDPPYMIIDAKYGTSQLSDTSDGKQMCEKWIYEKRLDRAVGKERADDIREAYVKGKVGAYVAHVEIGSVKLQEVDKNANFIKQGE